MSDTEPVFFDAYRAARQEAHDHQWATHTPEMTKAEAEADARGDK